MSKVTDKSLPPLPPPNYPVSKTGLQNNAYTESQMHDYARAALEAALSQGDAVAVAFCRNGELYWNATYTDALPGDNFDLFAHPQPAPQSEPVEAEGVDAIRQVIHELRTYSPPADQYNGKHIHPGWANRLEIALAATGKQSGSAVPTPHEIYDAFSFLRELVSPSIYRGVADKAYELQQVSLAATASRETVGVGPVGYANIHQLNNPRNDGVVLRRKDDEGFFTVPLYAAPPAQGVGDEERAEIFRKGWESGNAAQGVDLGTLRDLIYAWKNSDYPLSYEGGHSQRALNACIVDLLALIDQRDGEGK